MAKSTTSPSLFSLSEIDQTTDEWSKTSRLIEFELNRLVCIHADSNANHRTG